MDIFLSNFWWMIPNLALASLGFVFGLIYLNTKSDFLKLPLFILWLLFLPNTIYLITDLEHFFVQLPAADLYGAVLLTVQYLILVAFGVLTYFAGMVPMEKFFKRSKFKNYGFVFLVFNFMIAYAVVLGKTERTHSWYVFTQPVRVYSDILDVLITPMLITSVVLIAVIFNLIYFTFRRIAYLFIFRKKLFD